jgi:hypothetical protein
MEARSKRWDVSTGVGFGWRVRLGVGFGWEVFPDLGVFPAVIEGARERVGVPVAGDGVGQRFDDRWWVVLVGVTTRLVHTRLNG